MDLAGHTHTHTHTQLKIGDRFFFFFPVTPLESMNVMKKNHSFHYYGGNRHYGGSRKMALGEKEQDDGRPAKNVSLKSMKM